MAEDRWLEPRTRIPLAGIVAMVLIVAVVAVFLKTQLSSFFPETAIQVTDGASEQENVAGRASATFEGLREISLERKERLEGLLHQDGGARRFTVDVPARLLTITTDGRAEEILLEPAEAGALSAAFELDGASARVDVDTLSRSLLYSRPGVSAQPIVIPLAETLAYEGYFTYRNERLLYQYLPASQSTRIAGAAFDTVPLVQAEDGTLTGTWTRDGTQHPTRVDTTELTATVASVW